MKVKKILLVYVKCLVESVASVEKTFNQIIKELISEGREIYNSNPEMTKFKDGTSVIKVPFGTGLLGVRFTHLYIDEKVFEVEKGKQYVEEALMPLVVNEGVYVNMDAEGSPRERIKVFNLSDIKNIDEYNE